jgi:hypothetical protein
MKQLDLDFSQLHHQENKVKKPRALWSQQKILKPMQVGLWSTFKRRKANHNYSIN